MGLGSLLRPLPPAVLGFASPLPSAAAAAGFGGLLPALAALLGLPFVPPALPGAVPPPAWFVLAPLP
ncbi:hypothetical protein C3R30_21875, partial [Mycobacterium tuberculosis]